MEGGRHALHDAAVPMGRLSHRPSLQRAPRAGNVLPSILTFSSCYTCHPCQDRVLMKKSPMDCHLHSCLDSQEPWHGGWWPPPVWTCLLERHTILAARSHLAGGHGCHVDAICVKLSMSLALSGDSRCNFACMHACVCWQPRDFLQGVILKDAVPQSRK